MYTVEEANKKFCPTLRGSCVGDSCMAWRWALKTEKKEHNRTDGYYPPMPAIRIRVESTHGYCGLAGKQE